MLSTLSIRALSLLITVVLNSQSDHFNIPVISEPGSEVCPLSFPTVFFAFFLVIFLLVAGQDVLVKNNCCK